MEASKLQDKVTARNPTKAGPQKQEVLFFEKAANKHLFCKTSLLQEQQLLQAHFSSLPGDYTQGQQMIDGDGKKKKKKALIFISRIRVKTLA